MQLSSRQKKQDFLLMAWVLFIIVQVHNLKNPTSKTYECVKLLRTKYRYGLSGEPLFELVLFNDVFQVLTQAALGCRSHPNPN